MTETTTLNATAYTTAGKKREMVSLPAETFDGVVNMPVMHQAVKAYLANQRLGLAATKTRGFVIGGNKKPWRQKGTGRARQGSTRAPQWVGGGTVFGPSPRGYLQTVPKKIRQLARRSALNARAREEALLVVDGLSYEKPSTKTLVSLIGAIGGQGKKILILTEGVKPNVFLSGRNIQDVQVMPYSDVSTYHILWSDLVVVEAGALGTELPESDEIERQAEAPSAEKRGARSGGKVKSGGKASRKPAAKSAASKPAAKKAVKKTTAKKTSAKKSAPKKKGK